MTMLMLITTAIQMWKIIQADFMIKQLEKLLIS